MATAPPPVEYERDGYRWEGVNLVTENIGDAARDELRAVFTAVGFLPSEALRAIGAYAAEPATPEPVDFSYGARSSPSTTPSSRDSRTSCRRRCTTGWNSTNTRRWWKKS